MSTDDAKTVAAGEWVYDGDTPQPVRIIALAYDHWYEIGKADDQLEPDEEPTALGPDGVLYYASFTGVDSAGYPTIIQAMGAAQTRVMAPIQWHRLDSDRRIP